MAEIFDQRLVLHMVYPKLDYGASQFAQLQRFFQYSDSSFLECHSSDPIVLNSLNLDFLASHYDY